MPALGTVLFLLNIFFIIHAARTGRFWPWGFVMFFLPGFGVAAYLAFEVVPEWWRAPKLQRTQGHLAKTLNPGRRYRALRDEVATADTIGNRLALAEECLTLKRYDEALQLFDAIIRSPHGDEPVFYLGKARAAFGLERPDEVLEALDALKQRWPDYRSQDGHLLYARALEQKGQFDEALFEYESLSRYFAGPEPRVRQMQLLGRMGRRAEAEAIARDVVANLERAPRFARKQQAQWLAAAKGFLRA